MIEQLDVTALGVVAQAHLRPAPGLTAITGETGTGKTMVLTSLGLLLGRRADPALVRHGAAHAIIEGTVLLDPDAPAAHRATEAGADLEDGALYVTRSVPAEGRSRALLGGRTVPSSVLADVLGESVTVHGQADQLRLKSPDAQREALDAAAGPAHADALRAYEAAWLALREARAAARAFRDDTLARRAEIAALRDVVTRWDEAAPQDGEDAALRDEAGRLGNVEELRAAAAAAHAALSSEPAPDAAAAGSSPGAAVAVEDARARLAHVGHVDTTLHRLAERIGEIGYQIGDVTTELASYLAALDGDPERLQEVHTRLAQLKELSRGYEDLAAMGEQVTAARARLEELTGPGADAEAVQARLDEAASAVREAGAVVTAGRRAAAGALSADIDTELAGLSMPGAHLSIELLDRERPAAHGLEDVEFRLRPHPGAPPRPLGQGASGGELSRVMLALELVLARSGHGAPGDVPAATGARPTMVFDEIDAGIGGRTATQIGRRLAALAEHVQVIVVTHLAQVAAFAQSHYVVAKETAGEQTSTTVTEVTGEQRVDELARMLSGHDTDTARRHAAELLAAARVGD